MLIQRRAWKTVRGTSVKSTRARRTIRGRKGSSSGAGVFFGKKVTAKARTHTYHPPATAQSRRAQESPSMAVSSEHR
eukprot:6441835-Pyramimonas_sp.AAC.1